SAPGRRVIEPEPPRKSGGIAERKIKTEQHPLAARARIGQQITQQTSCGVAGGRIFDEPLPAAAIDGADPDAVAARFRLIGRAPIDDDEAVEHAVSAMLVRVVVVVMVVLVFIMAVVAAADVMMVRLLRQTDLVFVADDLRAVFAELAVHARRR